MQVGRNEKKKKKKNWTSLKAALKFSPYVCVNINIILWEFRILKLAKSSESFATF